LEQVSLGDDPGSRRYLGGAAVLAKKARRDNVSGRHSFRKLREKIDSDPERRERREEKRRAYDAVLNLAELREAKGLTQAELAARLGMSQPNVCPYSPGLSCREARNREDPCAR
jgi:ribosome-binding protein aMBF1 (putative translation factor)